MLSKKRVIGQEEREREREREREIEQGGKET